MSELEPTEESPADGGSPGSRRGPLQLLSRLPLAQHLKGYRRDDLKADARAGVNVSLLDFPQGMAYALIAGLPFQMGIYASAIASLIGPLFASSKHIMLGPTNAIAVLTLSGFLTLQLPDNQKLVALPLLLVLVGVFLILGALLRASIIVHYISRSVVTGYITAAACLIVANQVPNVFGFDTEAAATFGGVLVATVGGLHETHVASLILGLAAAALYLALKRYLKALPDVAVTLVLAGFALALLNQFLPEHGIQTLRGVTASDWQFGLPAFDPALLADLANVALGIAFLSLLESSSIARTLAARSGDQVDINQQMVSMGVANLGCAVGSGMPISGSLTRSALNWSSGARTPIASMISGVILTAGVLLVGPLVSYVPKPALAVLVILVGIGLVNRANIKMVLGTTRNDAVVFVITFGAGLLLPLNMAIYLGVAASIVLFLHQISRPTMVEYALSDSGELKEKGNKQEDVRPEVTLLHAEGDLFFGSADIFLDQARRIASDPNISVVVLRLKNAHHVDATCCMAIQELHRFMTSKGRHLILSGVHEGIDVALRRSGLFEQLGPENVFHFTPDNPNISTRNALKRAQELMGENKARIRLYVGADRAQQPPS